MCVRKRMESDSPFHENFPFGPFPRFPCCGNFFYSSEFMGRVLFFYFFMGIKVAFLIPPPQLLMMRQIKQSVTKQAMTKLKQIEQCVYII